MCLCRRVCLSVCVCVCVCPCECVPGIGKCVWVWLCLCVCVCVCVYVSMCVTPTAAQGRVTSPWCGGVTRGGYPWANTQSGGRPSPAAAAGSRNHAPHPPPATVGEPRLVQGGLHRGVAVCAGPRVSLWPSQPKGLRFFPPPSPYAPRVCTGASWDGADFIIQGATVASLEPGRAKGIRASMVPGRDMGIIRL